MVQAVTLVGWWALSATASAEVGLQQVSVRAGLEGDSNPTRALDAPGGGDVAHRYSLLGVGSAQSSNRRLALQLQGGAAGRWLVATPEEDAWVSQARLSGWHVWSRQVRAGVQGQVRDRTERGRFRDSLQGSGLAVVQGGGAGPVQVGVAGGYQGFRFKPQRTFDGHGPLGHLQVHARGPGGLDASLRGGLQGRLVAEVGDDVPAQGRRDLMGTVQARVGWTESRWMGHVGVQRQWNRSNTTARGFSRWMMDTEVGVPVGEAWVFRAAALVQRTRFSDGVLLDEAFALDEDNRNQMSLSAAWQVHPRWSLEGRWVHFREAFGGDDARVPYGRHLGYLGVAWWMRPPWS
jgi:hypothetical protein